MLYGVSPLTMELFPYNYRSSTTIPWKTNKPITGFYILVRMSNRFSYMLLWVKPEEWVVSLLCCGLQWVTAQNLIPSEECTGTSKRSFQPSAVQEPMSHPQNEEGRTYTVVHLWRSGLACGTGLVFKYLNVYWNMELWNITEDSHMIRIRFTFMNTYCYTVT